MTVLPWYQVQLAPPPLKVQVAVLSAATAGPANNVVTEPRLIARTKPTTPTPLFIPHSLLRSLRPAPRSGGPRSVSEWASSPSSTEGLRTGHTVGLLDLQRKP